MRSRKKFTIILLLVITFSYGINKIVAQTYEELAEETFVITSTDKKYEDPVCQNGEAAGDYTVKWNGSRDLMGSIAAKYEIFKDGEPQKKDDTYSTKEAAIAAGTSFVSWRKPSCCNNKDPKEGPICEGASICNEPSFDTGCSLKRVEINENECGGECEKEVKTTSWTCTKTTTSSGSNTRQDNTHIDQGVAYNYKLGQGNIKRMVMDSDIGGGGGSTTTSRTCTSNSDSTCCDSDETKTKTSTTYNYYGWNVKCEKPTLVGTGEYAYTERHIYNFHYEMDLDGSMYDGDEVYCVQPGAHGPGTAGEPYVLGKAFDLSKCRDQFTFYNSEINKYENAVWCGLAHIVYEAYDYNPTTKTFGNLKSGYSHAALTLALRLWLSSYGGGTDDWGLGSLPPDSEVLGWIPRESYYEVTASKFKNGTKYNTSNSVVAGVNSSGAYEKIKDLIFCAESEEEGHCVIDQAYNLFHKTENITKEEYMGGININKVMPTAYYESSSGKIRIKWDSPDMIKKIREKCTNPNDPDCIFEPHFYMYQNGKYVEVTNIVLKPDGANFCNKNTCDYIPEGIKERCFLGGDALKVVLVFKSWFQDPGFINFYVHAVHAKDTNPEDRYQIMAAMNRNLENCYQRGEVVKKGRVEIEVSCPCEKKCTDLLYTITNEKEGTCNPKKTISDPDMNCITNSCDPKIVADYDITADYDVDPTVCTLYEREDNEINMPAAVSTYSGMQFSYDIGKNLGSQSNKKLTSVIVQKRQITSKIDIDHWMEEYNKKVDLLEKAYGLKPDEDSDRNYSNEYRKTIVKDINNWIYTLRNCNLLDKEDNNDSRTYAVNQLDKMIDNIVNCNGLGCKSANLEVSYDDPKYGQQRELAVERHLLGSNIYYCQNNGCNTWNMTYPPNGSFSSPSKNPNTVSINYYANCSTTSCAKGTITIPTNTFATKVYSIEHDYYNDKKYSAQAYTGTALEEGAVTAEKTSTPLADYVYPVSSSLKTNLSDGENSYGVNFHYTNITNKKLKDFSTSEKCLFKVYNRTTAYDCKITDSKGNVDLSKCRDTKYEVTNGVPKIDENNQIEWVLTNKKQYGYVFRNIDLANPFPNKLKNRTSVINWTEADIKAIQDTAEKIFTNGDYLDYSYTLTTQTIKQIKAYNDRQKKSGGYLNNTLEKCTITKDDTGLSIFTECRSNFLHGELRDYVGIQIGGKKAGVN